jgi:hypothetical protein
MSARRLFLSALTILLLTAPARADDWQKLLSRGAEAYYLDQDVRAAFAKDRPGALPESKRKLPAATAAAFDWTTVISRPHNYAQRKSPLCWAFAAMTAFEYNWAIRNGGTAPVLAVQPIVDRTGKDGGAPVSLAMEALLQRGTAPLSAYPFSGGAAKLRPNVELAYRLIAWGDVVPGGDMPTPAQIKQALLDHGPVTANVFVTPLFENYKGGVFREHFKVPADAKVTHALVIVGWDDRKGKGCWKVQNSWGPNWGEAGFMWIEYGCNNIGQEACWVRCQSDQYRLPEDVHKHVVGDMVPFHTWSKSRAVTLPPKPELPKLSAAEALKMRGERVVVRLPVKAFGRVEPSGDVEMFSETNPDDEACLTVRLLASEFAKFPAKDFDGLRALYRGKEVLVRGSVQLRAYKEFKRPVIEVADPAQIEVVK